ncbi:MAG TPA: hypothetical protein DC057_02330 [Spirochaetia bacterium]|nr:hypothetical protein [Spirochaetia bacterium]
MPHKPKINQIETPNIVQGRDTFQTPNYAVELLIPFIPKHIKYVWECACGDCKISNVLKQYGFIVKSTDLKYGINFLNESFPFSNEFKNESMIITNPPYSLKRKFYNKCKEHGVLFALLIPADYCGWLIDSIRCDGSEKIIPDRRIDYITPTGKNGMEGSSCFTVYG